MLQPFHVTLTFRRYEDENRLQQRADTVKASGARGTDEIAVVVAVVVVAAAAAAAATHLVAANTKGGTNLLVSQNIFCFSRFAA